MNLILTFDYELFGDGLGDIFTHIIEPSKQILQLCDKHNIKTTIFFEVLEYIKLKEEWEKGNTMGYTENPVKAIEQQIQQAAKVPVLVSNIHGPMEIIGNGKHGAFFESENIVDCAQKIAHIIDNYKEYSSVAEQAFKYCTKNFSIQTTAKKYITNY